MRPRPHPRLLSAALVLAGIVTASRSGRADEPEGAPPASSPSKEPEGAPPASSPSKEPEGAPPASSPRKEPEGAPPASSPSKEPEGAPPASSPPAGPMPFFKVDPVADGAFIVAGIGLSTISGAILSTNEIRPQRPGSTEHLLGIDRVAVTQSVSNGARLYSNLGLYATIAYAVIDPVVTGVRSGPTAGLVDAMLYAETIAFTQVITDIAKVAVRRPRPLAYREQEALDQQYGGADRSPSISSTDASLSFFSNHAATTAGITATATYLSFIRHPKSIQPWLTLAGGTVITALTGYWRVRTGSHFSTDVVTGTLVGAGIGLVVPHLHRADSTGHVVWVGASPARDGGTVTLQGIF